jgi:hypothetical protein
MRTRCELYRLHLRTADAQLNRETMNREVGGKKKEGDNKRQYHELLTSYRNRFGPGQETRREKRKNKKRRQSSHKGKLC